MRILIFVVVFWKNASFDSPHSYLQGLNNLENKDNMQIENGFNLSFKKTDIVKQNVAAWKTDL